MDPTMFLAAPSTEDPNRPDPAQIDAFFAEHGTEPFWTRSMTAISAAWHLVSHRVRCEIAGRGGFAQRRLSMLD